MHGSRWQGLETDVAMDGELCTTGKPAWNRRAPALRHAPRQPLTLLMANRPTSVAVRWIFCEKSEGGNKTRCVSGSFL